MATRTFPASNSSLFATTGGSNLGGGADEHLSVGGPWNGYTFRGVIIFTLDFSGMKAIQSAMLNLVTSTQVHLGFSSTPDFYIQRATSGWTANGSSSSSEGGSGWSTSPTTWPGPASTATGRVAKRAPTGETANFSVDIAAIVRAWAPASVEGGGGQGNYGILLLQQATGDATEFRSVKAPSGRPSITVTYTTDTPPPAPTITGPTGTVTTLRPTLTATAVDPDGDPLEVGDVEVYKAAALVHSAVGVAALDATHLSYVPTADLPSGALTVRWRARAAGVYGAWSAQAPFTVDRPPTVTGFSAPTGNVSGTLRPVHTWASTDPDGDALQAWDLEVYQSAAGAPTGTAVYQRLAQTTGISGMTVSHTPTADLPPGPLLARARVQTAGVWSAWSAYAAYTIVTNNPTAFVKWPRVAGGSYLFLSQLAAPDVIPSMVGHQMRYQVEGYPPASTTLTGITRTFRRMSDGATPEAPVVAIGGNFGLVPAGGVFSQPVSGVASAGWVNPWGLGEVESIFTSSNGGSTTARSQVRHGYGEWFGALFLGDHVASISVDPLPSDWTSGSGNPIDGRDYTAVWYRAQTSPTAANGSAPWRPSSALATVAAEMPATNAYLGVCIRIVRQTDPNVIQNGGPADLRGWTPLRATVAIDLPGGGQWLRVIATGSGSTSEADNGAGATGYRPRQPVTPGVPYWFRASAQHFSGNKNATALLQTYDAGGTVISTGAVRYDWNPGTVEDAQVAFTPAAGVAFVSARLVVQAPTAAGDAWRFRRIELVRQDAVWPGFDRLKITWRADG